MTNPQSVSKDDMTLPLIVAVAKEETTKKPPSRTAAYLIALVGLLVGGFLQVGAHALMVYWLSATGSSRILLPTTILRVLFMLITFGLMKALTWQFQVEEDSLVCYFGRGVVGILATGALLLCRWSVVTMEPKIYWLLLPILAMMLLRLAFLTTTMPIQTNATTTRTQNSSSHRLLFLVVLYSTFCFSIHAESNFYYSLLVAS